MRCSLSLRPQLHSGRLSAGERRAAAARVAARLGPSALIACFLVAGCAAPFGVRHASPEKVHRALTSNVLSTGELSNPTMIALHRRNLTETYRANPAATLRTLHSELEAGHLSHDDLFVLAELSYQYGSGKGGKPYFLAAAVYAYAFVFPDDPQAAPQPFDPRQRVAMDIYNRALAESFKSADREHVDVAAGAYPLPFGVMEISFDERQLDWGRRRLVRFSPSAEVEVIGFNNRYRQPGIGAPLAAAIQPLDQNAPARDYIGPNVHVPVTALLRIEEPNRQFGRHAADRPVGALSGDGGIDDAYRWSERAPRAGADSGPGALRRRRPAVDAGARHLPRQRPADRERSQPYRARATSAGPHPARLRARHRVEPQRVAEHDQRSRQRPGHPPALRGLALPLRQRPADPVFRHATAASAVRARAGASSRRSRPVRRQDGRGRAQPGRPARQADGDPLR